MLLGMVVDGRRASLGWLVPGNGNGNRATATTRLWAHGDRASATAAMAVKLFQVFNFC